MSALSTNLRVLAGAMQHTIRRRRGIGHLQTREVATLLDASAAAIEQRDARIAKLTAIVKDIAPAKLQKKARKARKA